MIQQRHGDWMQTFTGRKFYVFDPDPADIDPIDIAHALSLLCRYGGHVDRFYSVAEHCVLLSYAVEPEHALWALLHDAAEAYVGDMVRPLKVSMPEYCLIEDGIMGAVMRRFDLTGPMPATVKLADARILLNERDTLMSKTQHTWDIDHLEPVKLPKPWRVRGLSPQVAENIYATRLEELINGGKPWTE